MAGPMPGSTPTNVPRRTPIAAYSSSCGVKASAKPPARRSSVSMSEHPVQDAGGERHTEVPEEVPARDGHHGADDQVTDERLAAERPRRARVEQRPGDRPAADVHQHQVEYQDADQLEDGDPVGGRRQFDVLALLALGDV